MTVLVSDSFNRADASTLGTTDSYNGGSAKSWIQSGGSVGIISNQAGITTQANSFAVIDAGVSDVSYSITDSVYHMYTDWIWRYQDSSNYYFIEGQTAYKKIAGTNTTLGTLSGGQISNGTVIKIVVSGSTHTIYTNGTQALTFTDTALQTATKFGFKLYATTARVDNFEIDDLTTGSSGTTYSESNTAQGQGSTTSSESVWLKATGIVQGQGSTSDTSTVIFTGSGTAQGTGSTTSSETTTQVYSGSGTAQGQGSTSDTNTYQAAGLYSGGGTAQGQASTTSSENVWKSGGGISSGSGSTTSSDSVWLAAGGTASGTSSTISADSIGQPTIYPGSGVAQGLASTESSEAYFKPGKIIQVKRGIERNLPSLAMGEFALTTDTGKLFIGTNQGNMQLATQVDINNLSQTITNLSIGSRLYTSTAMGWG